MHHEINDLPEKQYLVNAKLVPGKHDDIEPDFIAQPLELVRSL
jgi:hypothetical protein